MLTEKDNKTRWSRLAIVSLICGILSFLGIIFAQLTLIILTISFGYVSLKQIKESKIVLRGKGMAISGIFLGCLSLLLIRFPLSVHFRVREHLRMAVCITNLREIGEALYFYAADHDGNFPERLNALYPHYLSKPTLFWCPSDKGPKPTTIDNNKPNKENSACISYQYNSGHRQDEPITIPLVWDNSLIHNDGGNILYVGGQVIWRPSSSWKTSPDGSIYPGKF